MRGSAIYRVLVRGWLNPDSADRVDGMNITLTAKGENEEQTILVGRVPDQSARLGILNTLYEMHLPVVSVECLAGE